MRCAVVLFTRDLRVHDNPALAAAAREAERVLPLFVLDDTLLGVSERRSALLASALADLHGSLRTLGAGLVVRSGDPVAETVRVARACEAEAVFVAEDVSPYATRRERKLREALELRTFPGVTVVPPGEVAPGDRDHYRVFTPYHRAWAAELWRALEDLPRRLELP